MERKPQPSLDLSLSLAPSSSSPQSRQDNGSTPTRRRPSPTRRRPPLLHVARSGRRKPSNHVPKDGTKSLTIARPFAWAGYRRATLRPLDDVLKMGVTSVEGRVRCTKCGQRAVVSRPLEENFWMVVDSIASVMERHWHKAPPSWMEPKCRPCSSCYRPNCVRPVVDAKKRSINWLFMFLEESIGACNISQLKYFCKHNSEHRSGSKAQLVLYVYLHIYRQLDPSALRL